jgi:formylglycine-generating enzyme required for sulfatase activity
MEKVLDAKQLVDYTIIKLIGQGSLGTVYLAEHRFMKKQFAIKVLPEELSSDRAFIQRFEEEISALACLDHPNIVKIHNISFDKGQYFLVTDCVVDDCGETTNLTKYLRTRESPLNEQEIWDLLKQLAEALDYAHSRQFGGVEVVHRGIKLNNILVSKKGGKIKVYLSDFGLSRVIGTGAVLSRTYKAVAEALGMSDLYVNSMSEERYPNPPADMEKQSSLHASFLQNFLFLAPEQKKFEFENEPQISAKADVYAFGVLTYYLLLGEFPEGYFALPLERRKELRWNWDLLIIKCMQTYPEQRPAQLVPLMEEILDTPHPKGATHHPLAESLQEQMKGGEEEETAEPKVLRPIIESCQLERPETDPNPASAFMIDTTVKFYTPERREVKEVKPLLSEMAIIEGGTFWRGSNDANRDEMPRHQVHVASFAMDIHPVTNEQYVRFLEFMGGEKDSNYNDIIRLRDSRIKRVAGRLTIESGYSKHPVVGVTWYGAAAYAKWVGKRLPYEVEREIAASGGKENLLYPTGDDIEKTQANFFSSDTIAVMSYPPTCFGLYDMAGNVYEWCNDWYGYNYYEASIQEPENPKGPLQGVYRVLRGGCWKSLKEDLRCSKRHRNNPGTVNGTYGFRCAADVQ